jgi:hypothetical protein
MKGGKYGFTLTNGHVFEVQRRVNLVHHVQWRGFVMVQRKHQTEAAERLLTT